MSDFGHDETDKELKQLEARISAEYKVAAADLELKMNKYLSDFARKDEMMKKDMQAGKMSEDDYLIWRRNQIIIGKRWETMLDSVTKDMVNADKLAASMINKSLPNVYAQNMNYGTYEVESGTRVDTGFTLYDRSTVENLLKEDPHIIKFAKIDEEKDERWNKKKIESAVLQGILQGESMPKIASRLKSVADMGDNAAIRNARTYTTAAENKGRMDSYERCQEMGIKMKKKWIATLDDRTRVEHRHLDEMVVDIDEPFKTDGYEIMYPGDPEAEGEMIYNCRCTLVSEIPGIMYDDKRYDEKLGDMTYEEWKHAKDKPAKETPAVEPAKEIAVGSIIELPIWGQGEIKDIDGDFAIVEFKGKNHKVVMDYIKENNAVVEKAEKPEEEKIPVVIPTINIESDKKDEVITEVQVPQITNTRKFEDSRSADEYFRGYTYESKMGSINSSRGYGVRAEDNKPATKWENKLTSNQTQAIVDYTGMSYEPINNFLRGIWDKDYANDNYTGRLDNVNKAIKNMDSALKKSELKENITVYRTCEREFLDKLSVGGIFHDDGYGSTSVISVPAASGDVHMEIDVPAGKGVGAYVDGLSWKEGEEFEFLLARGADYYIESLEERKDGIYVKAAIAGFTRED